MDGHVKVGGAWKALKGLHVKVAGTWKEVQRGHVKVSGVWKQFYTFATVILTGSSGSPNSDDDQVVSPGTANAGWTFNSSGDLTKVSGDAWAQPEWFGEAGETTHTTPDQTYYIRATLDAGTAPSSGPALNTWHALSTTRTWTWTRSSLGATQGDLQIDIASDSGGTNIVDTGYYRGRAEVVS